MEEISKTDASAGVIMPANNSLVCWGIEKYASGQLAIQFKLADMATEIEAAYLLCYEATFA